MNDKEIIRGQANIDISNLHMAQEQGIITEFGKGKLEALEGIVDFIDSMQEKPVSEDLEEVSKEWLRPQLDKSYADYGEVKMMELTHFDGYAMLDAIEFGAKWKEQQMMTKSIEAVVSQVPCSNEIILYNPSSVYEYSLPQEMNELGLNKGDKIKVIIIKSE